MKTLIETIDEYLSLSGLAETTFGLRAANDGKFVSRIRAGKRTWPETEARVRAWMAENAPESARRRAIKIVVGQ